MYNREEILQQLITAIEREECTSLDEASLFVPCTRASLYNWGFDKMDEVKEAIQTQRIKAKSGMRKNWRKSDNATLQVAAYKLMATDEELEKLTVNNNNNRNSGELAITWNEVKTYETK